MLHRWGNLSKEESKILNKHFETLLSIKMRKVELDEKAIQRARFRTTTQF